MNILIADDSLLGRSYIKKTLGLIEGMSAAKYIEAKNGKEALDVIQSNSIQCLFLDINMPIMNGIELVDKINELGFAGDFPIIITSSLADGKRIELLSTKGIKHFLKKPFSPEALAEIAGLYCGRSKIKTHKMQEILLQILEQTFFIFTTPTTESYVGKVYSNYIDVQMKFSGEINGTFSLMVPDALGIEIASNFLGMEPTDPIHTKETPGEAVGEVLNIVGANVLTAILGENGNFEIGLPTQIRVPEFPLDEEALNESALLVTDSGDPIILRMKE